MEMQEWRVGDISITPIIEADASDVIQSIITHATEDAIRGIPWLHPDFADANGRLRAVVQAFLIRTPRKNILIDACIGNHKPRTDTPAWSNLTTNFLNMMKSAGCSPEEVDIVFCTHLHFDHVGWNTIMVEGEWRPTFPNAVYYFSRSEYAYWQSVPPNEIADDHAGFADSVAPIVKAGLAQFIDNDFVIDDCISLFPTPGHTPGHVSVRLTSNGLQAFISGDALHHPCQMAHPAWSTIADTDQEKARQSRTRLLCEAAGSRSLFIGSHFSPPSAGLVVKEGDRFRLVSQNG